MAAQTGWRLRQQTPSPERDPSSNSRPPKTRPRPDASRPRGGELGGATASSSSASSSKAASYSSLVRTPSRTQIRHATAARRLSGEGFVSNGDCTGNGRVKEAPPPIADENCSRNDSTSQAGPSSSQSSLKGTPLRRDGSGTRLTDDISQSAQQTTPTPQRPKLKRSPGSVTASEIIYALATGKAPSLSSATKPSASEQEYYRALAQEAEAQARQKSGQQSIPNERPAPLLAKTLQAVGVDLMVDSTNLKTLALAQHLLKATYMTPCTVLDMLAQPDLFCFIWLTVEETLQRLPPDVHVKNLEHLEYAVKQAIPKLIAEISYAVNDCGTHNEGPHYAFLDPRFYEMPNMNDAVAQALEQADTIAVVLGEKGLKREQLYFNIPANEAGLRIAHALKERFGFQSNLVFVSNLVQARACASIGVESVTVPVGKIVKREERANPFFHSKSRSVAYEGIQAISCYMKKHGLSTKVIGTDLRELSDLRYLSCLDGIAIREAEVEKAKWMQLRVDKPPQDGSPAIVRAANVQAPLSQSTTSPSSSSGSTSGSEEPFNFFNKLSSKSKQETTTLIEEGLAEWKAAMVTIEDALRAQFERRCFIRRKLPAELERTDTEPLEEEYDGELIGFPVYLDTPRDDREWEGSIAESYERGRGKTTKGLQREKGGRSSMHRRSLSRCSTVLDVPFPVSDDPMVMEEEDDRGPRPSDEILLQSPMVQSKHSFDFDSDSDSGSEEEFLV
ncbi:hypothetical protein SCHPADRAFT_945451 [Schizopora paradoxa]|uniref:Transaldolase n=1 Tax=Schizopora paradoxa TaxID=27342 RepID=A0A0H2R617_9AGAM|nr:hypothetical protein SCHPADRAFT_945451 [Schizopora paradoxa]